MHHLPNYENAFISLEKLAEYCLNEFHPTGKNKALVFKAALGISAADAPLLKKCILAGLANNECTEKETDEYGKRYLVKMKIRIFENEADIITGWIILPNEIFARLTTCFIKK